MTYAIWGARFILAFHYSSHRTLFNKGTGLHPPPPPSCVGCFPPCSPLRTDLYSWNFPACFLRCCRVMARKVLDSQFAVTNPCGLSCLSLFIHRRRIPQPCDGVAVVAPLWHLLRSLQGAPLRNAPWGASFAKPDDTFPLSHNYLYHAADRHFNSMQQTY